MDQRRCCKALPYILFFIFISSTALSQEVVPQANSLVESTPLDPFSQEAGLWNVDTISSEKNNFDYQNPFESMGSRAGIQSKYRGSPTISIRGSQSLPRVLGLYNSIPINSSDGFGPQRLLIPHEIIDDTKIIKGPASLFYGADALGGVINFQSKKISRPLLRSSLSDLGSRNLTLVTPITSSPQPTQLSAYFEDDPGEYPYTLKSTGSTGTRKENNHHLQRYTLQGDQSFEQLSLSENFIWAQEVGASPGSALSPYTTQSRLTSFLGESEATYNISHQQKIGLRYYHTRHENEYRDLNDSSFLNSYRHSGHLYYMQNTNTLNYQLVADFDHDEFISTSSGSLLYQENQPSTAAFLEAPILNQWLFKPGIRYISLYNQWIPALGLFEETEEFSRWLTYSEGFRPPSMLQKYANTAYSEANPNLKPESSQQFELGFKKMFVPNTKKDWEIFETKFVAFFTEYKNFISNQTLSNNKNLPVNTSKSRSSGFELSANYSPGIWITDLNYSYLKTEDEGGHTLPFSPENQIHLTSGFRYSILINELVLNHWSQFYEKTSTQWIELPSWTTLDLNIRTSPDLNDWHFKFSILNILDTPVELSKGYPEPQRRFYLTAERTF